MASAIPPKGFEPLFLDRKVQRPGPLDEGGLSKLGSLKGEERNLCVSLFSVPNSNARIPSRLRG